MNDRLTLDAELLRTATALLDALLVFAQPADTVLSQFFRARRQTQSERAFIAETVYAVLRRLRWLRAVSNATTPRQLLLASLIKLNGISQRQLAAGINAADRTFIVSLNEPRATSLTSSDLADFPDWLIERLGLPEEDLLTLARGLNQPAPLDLRVNCLKAARDAVLAQLKSAGLAVELGRYAPNALRVAGRPSLARHPLFLSGQIEVQDEGSQLLALLLAPRRGQMVADFCAGSGGKTLLLGELMRSTGRLYAFDVSAKRLARLSPRLARSGLSNVHPLLIDNENDARVKRLTGKFDRVLVDAPCTGLGSLRRNPDLKWRRQAQDIAELVAKQTAILTSAARLLKPGGRLVYATCSILTEENAGVVDTFLATHNDFRRLDALAELARQGMPLSGTGDLRLLPHLHGTDGFYAALLERQA